MKPEITREKVEICLNAEVSKRLEKHGDKRLYGMFSLLPKVLCSKGEENICIEVLSIDPIAWRVMNSIIRANLTATAIRLQILPPDRVQGIEEILKQDTKHKLIMNAKSRFAILMIETADNTIKLVVWELPE